MMNDHDDDDDGDVQDGRIITENWRLDPQKYGIYSTAK
jgi:hypothetical protein